MKMLPALTLSAVLGLGSTFLFAQDAPTEKPADKSTEAPADKKPGKAMKSPRLVQPWSKMTSLTPEQKSQIATIHKQASADKKKIDDKETEDILALLTPEQKAEVDKLKDDATTAKKAKPATQPDAGM